MDNEILGADPYVPTTDTGFDPATFDPAMDTGTPPFVFNPRADSDLATQQLGLTPADVSSYGTASGWGDVMKALGLTPTTAALLAGGVGLSALLGGDTPDAGYKGGIPSLIANRTMLPIPPSSTGYVAPPPVTDASGAIIPPVAPRRPGSGGVTYFTPMTYTRGASNPGISTAPPPSAQAASAPSAWDSYLAAMQAAQAMPAPAPVVAAPVPTPTYTPPPTPQPVVRPPVAAPVTAVIPSGASSNINGMTIGGEGSGQYYTDFMGNTVEVPLGQSKAYFDALGQSGTSAVSSLQELEARLNAQGKPNVYDQFASGLNVGTVGYDGKLSPTVFGADKGVVLSAGIGGPAGQTEAQYQQGIKDWLKASGVPGYASGGIASLSKGRLLNGPGDGVSDSIPASIDGHQPAALADGEYVIPARIVSELGNGSTKAGAQQLDAMMKRIQTSRRKATDIAADTKTAKHLPA